jgi:hypothetical protein
MLHTVKSGKNKKGKGKKERKKKEKKEKGNTPQCTYLTDATSSHPKRSAAPTEDDAENQNQVRDKSRAGMGISSIRGFALLAGGIPQKRKRSVLGGELASFQIINRPIRYRICCRLVPDQRSLFGCLTLRIGTEVTRGSLLPV